MYSAKSKGLHKGENCDYDRAKLIGEEGRSHRSVNENSRVDRAPVRHERKTYGTQRHKSTEMALETNDGIAETIDGYEAYGVS